jgi:hypothetical protein
MSDPHMTDKELDAVIRAWMPEAPTGQPDRSRVVGSVVSRLGSTRGRRRRWWPFSVFRPEATPPWLTDQPSPISAGYDHTPTVIGRTQTMFSPAKVVTVGAFVVGIGGVRLIAQPFD